MLNMRMTNTNIQLKLSELKATAKKLKLSPEARILFNSFLFLFDILLAKLLKNSRNSSIPPSQDSNRVKKPKDKSKKKSGGQPGHTGITLKKVDHPDKIISLGLNRKNLPRGVKYTNSEPETRQVIDFEVKLSVTEYQAEVLIDENGKRYVADFPSHVKTGVQYGCTVKANAVYMSYFQMCSLDRIVANFSDQLKIKISQGSIFNFCVELDEKLQPWEDWLKTALKSEDLLHADETGANVNGKKYWLHTLCNNKYTLFSIHEKRGKEAMDEMGVLPYFKGNLCHDHWKPYFQYLCSHLLCNAHHLRELTYAEEVEKQTWAKKMRLFLLEINEEVKKEGGELNTARQKKITVRYQKILREGEKECPASAPIKGKRGRTKQTKARNLLERLQDFEKETLRFMTKASLPFTNNQGENDLRMTKVKLKVAGCFRSLQGACIFARVRGFINTCIKNNLNVSEAINAVFKGNLEQIIKKIAQNAE